MRYRDAELLQPSRLGLRLAGADLSQNLKLEKAGELTKGSDRYQLQTDKRTNCHYQANRRVFRFAGGQGTTLSVVLQVSNDGVAFQYLVGGPAQDVQRLEAEQTSCRLGHGAGCTRTPRPRPAGPKPSLRMRNTASWAWLMAAGYFLQPAFEYKT